MIRAWALLWAVMPSAVWAAPPVVAIFDVEDQKPVLTSPVRDQLSAYLRGKMAEQGSFKVVPPGELKRRLKEQKQQSYRQCYEQSCQIAIGRELAAQKSLATQLLVVGSQCVLMSTLYDLKSAASERSASAKTACKPDELLAIVDELVARLQPAVVRHPAAGSPAASEDRDDDDEPPPEEPPADAVSAPPLRPAALPAAAAEPNDAEPQSSWMSTWKWLTGAAALAGVSAGIALAVRASSRARELEALISDGNPSLSQPTEPFSAEMSRLEDEYDTSKKASMAMFAVGGALAVGSALLFAFDRKKPPRRRSAIVAPVIGSGGAIGLSGQVRF